MTKSVFHIRLKDFELQAERTMDATLRTRAVAVLSSHHQNGTVVALSEEARQEGLWVGMKVSLARRMSHGVLLLPYNSTLYQKMNDYLYRIVSSFSPVVEPSVYGQFYLDMTGMDRLYRTPIQAGSLVSKAIYHKVSLSGQVGISANKLVSRISTEVVPERIYEITSGYESAFMAPLMSRVLPSADEKSVRRILKFLFLKRVREVQQVVAQPEAGESLFGSFYRKVAMEARGQDTSLVKPPPVRDHIMEQKILAEDTNDEGILRSAVRNLAEQVAFQLRRKRRVAKSISVEVHYTDGFKQSRKGAVMRNDDISVANVCLRLFEKANYRRNRVRSILIDANRLKPVSNQLNLFDQQPVEDIVLAKALDQIRRKYGFNTVFKGSCGQSVAIC